MTARREAGASQSGAAPILQLHPTRLCNLACAHCYTSSGPRETQQLPLPLLCAVLDDAVALGYRQLAVSGGEPLLYEDLPHLLRHARQLGMLTSLTSNGLLLSPQRWAAIAPLLDRLAISVDGREATHDALRGQPGALARSLRLLAQPRATGTPFGFIFTLTQHNVDELEDVVGLAAAHGAHGAQGVQVQVDALSQAQIRAHREQLVPAWPAPGLTTLAPALVLQADGQLLPLTHELPPALWLGSVHKAPLKALAARWLHSSASRRLVQALERTWQELAGGGRQPAAYWYDEVAARVCPPRGGRAGVGIGAAVAVPAALDAQHPGGSGLRRAEPVAGPPAQGARPQSFALDARDRRTARRRGVHAPASGAGGVNGATERP